MSFGKPKNPLLELVNPAHTEFHIEKLEANMRGEPFVMKCGCTFSNPYRGGKVMTRCERHAKYTEGTPDPPKEEKE